MVLKYKNKYVFLFVMVLCLWAVYGGSLFDTDWTHVVTKRDNRVCVCAHKAHFICNKSWESSKHKKKPSFRLRERRWPFAWVHWLQYPIRYVSLCILMMHSLQWFAAYSQSRTFMYLKCHWFPKIETQPKMSANSVQNQSLNQTIQIQMR